jgi:hypothetical protein
MQLYKYNLLEKKRQMDKSRKLNEHLYSLNNDKEREEYKVRNGLDKKPEKGENSKYMSRVKGYCIEEEKDQEVHL